MPARLRTGWLALCGSCFYAFYGGLWLGVFVLEILVSRFYRPRGRIALLGVVQAVLILTVVKYGAFFGNTLGALLGPGVIPPVPPFALPLGLSFFIFEFIHYAADRYQGRAKPQSVIDYAAVILFFPAMVAGPIKRVQDFSESVGRAEVNADHLWAGLWRIGQGLFKKAVIADNLNIFLEYAFSPDRKSVV